MKKTSLQIGDVVLIEFPFSDLKGKKLRPALVVANVEFADSILCQITSKPYSSSTAIRIRRSDFATGSLPIISFVRPDKLFTAYSSIIQRKVGRLDKSTCEVILEKIRELFQYNA